MQYILTENKQVILGPMFWKQRFIQSELNDLEVDFTVPPVEQGYIQINDSLEIFPVVASTMPAIDAVYEQLVGPTYTFDNNEAVETYTSTPIDISLIKSVLIQLAATERYKKEVAGTTAVIQGTTVTVATDRDARNIFVQKYFLMGNTDVVSWKFPEGWLQLTKTDLFAAITAGAAYIQSQFDMENSIVNQITAATTIDSLKQIAIVAPKTNIQGA